MVERTQLLRRTEVYKTSLGRLGRYSLFEMVVGGMQVLAQDERVG